MRHKQTDKFDVATGEAGLEVVSWETIHEVKEAYDQFWRKNQIEKNIGTGRKPIFIRSDRPRLKPWAGTHHEF